MPAKLERQCHNRTQAKMDIRERVAAYKATAGVQSEPKHNVDLQPKHHLDLQEWAVGRYEAFVQQVPQSTLPTDKRKTNCLANSFRDQLQAEKSRRLRRQRVLFEGEVTIRRPTAPSIAKIDGELHQRSRRFLVRSDGARVDALLRRRGLTSSVIAADAVAVVLGIVSNGLFEQHALT